MYNSARRMFEQHGHDGRAVAGRLLCHLARHGRLLDHADHARRTRWKHTGTRPFTPPRCAGERESCDERIDGAHDAALGMGSFSAFNALCREVGLWQDRELAEQSPPFSVLLKPSPITAGAFLFCRPDAMDPTVVSPDYESCSASGQRASRLRTFETCHRPPRAVRTPRLFRAMAIPRRLVMPECRIDWMIGSTVSANLSASRSRDRPTLGSGGAGVGWIAELCPVSLAGGEGGFGALRDQPPLLLGESGIEVEHKRVGVGVLTRQRRMARAAPSGRR